MFTVFDATGNPATVCATEPFAWSVAIATHGTGVEYPTGKFHRKCPTTLTRLASRMALTILRVSLNGASS